MVLGTVGTGQRQYVFVVHFLPAVGQGEELPVDGVHLLLVVDFHAQHLQTVLQRGTSAAGGQHDGVVVESHVLGVHYLVGLHILQHAVLMDAA